jgi:hypothetical protein
MTETNSTTRTLRGSCHCGAVKFMVHADPERGASRCNCSLCTKLGGVRALVKPEAFELESDPAALGAYEWRNKISKNYFCKSCGTHCYSAGHLAEVGGDFVSFNYNAIDDFEISELELVHWDGRHDNWDAGPSVTPWPILQRTAAPTAAPEPPAAAA